MDHKKNEQLSEAVMSTRNLRPQRDLTTDEKSFASYLQKNSTELSKIKNKGELISFIQRAKTQGYSISQQKIDQYIAKIEKGFNNGYAMIYNALLSGKGMAVESLNVTEILRKQAINEERGRITIKERKDLPVIEWYMVINPENSFDFQYEAQFTQDDKFKQVLEGFGKYHPVGFGKHYKEAVYDLVNNYNIIKEKVEKGEKDADTILEEEIVRKHVRQILHQVLG